MNKYDITDEINYLTDTTKLGEAALESIHRVTSFNNAVGTISGYYDDKLTILSASKIFVNNLGFNKKEFKLFSEGSFRNLFFGENQTFLEPDRFPNIKGYGEGEMLTKDGTPVTVQMYKEDSIDEDGKAIWIMSVRVDWEHENVTLINGAIQSGLWYFDCDVNGEISEVHWSHAFRKILGYRDVLDFPNELSSWSDLLYPADKKKTLNRLLDAIADKTNQIKYNVEYRLKMKDGTYQWFRANAEIARRTDGTARRITGIFVNIDTEKRAVLQQKKAEAFHNAFTKTNLCEYFVNIKDNEFESMKTVPSIMTSFEKNGSWDELIAKFADYYVCDEYKEKVRLFYNRESIVSRWDKCIGELNLECQIILDDEIRWVRNVILPGDREESHYAIIFIRDITDSKREAEIQRKMSEENEAMGHLIQSVTRLVDHFVICDLENDRYEYSVLNIKAGYSPRGKYSDFIVSVTNKFKTIEPLEPLKDILSPQNLKENLKHKNDIYKFEYCSYKEDLYRSASFIPLEWKGDTLTKVLWVAIDITQEKKQEIIGRKALVDAYQAAERANKAKTEFLTNMSHDIRTPMNAIVGLTAIAGANIESQDKIIECLSKITSASRLLLGLINEVLDMARIESGRVSLSEEEFNLPELVDNLVTLVQPSVQEHNHNFKVLVKNIEHEEVYGDTLRIQQVFVNLMSNAIKYTPDGGDIVFSIEEKDNVQSGLGCYEFRIEDNGIGMDEDFQKIMFQPFTRADDTRTTKIQGTGLGMAITKNIVNMMNGDIRVESSPNMGTKFLVTIYLKLQDKEGIDKIKELENLPVLVVDDDIISCESTVDTLKDITNVDYSNMRILLVEDNDLNREIAYEIIKMSGVKIETAENGKEALEKVESNPENWYDLVFMDIQMPVMNGYETTAAIRSLPDDRSKIPIVAMTANAFAEDVQMAKNTGMNGHIAKPLDLGILSRILKKYAVR